MAFFPLFVDLKDKNCIIIGGGVVAVRKVETLLKFNPLLTVISELSDPEIRKLAAAGKIAHLERRYQAGDLKEAFLAIAATNDPEINHQIYEEATQSGIWVNVVDDPGKCTFIFPAIVQRDQTVVGITSSGIFPALTKKIREKIDQLLPASLSEATGTLQQARERAQSTISNVSRRKAILGDMAQMALNNEPLDLKAIEDGALTDEQKD